MSNASWRFHALASEACNALNAADKAAGRIRRRTVVRRPGRPLLPWTIEEAGR